ncbi:MAG: MBL fold metallo-hydrolase [Clostridia bacterium]|nr:MBL fold metallo-hydrolase [Clostridia bacterium]
MILDKLTVGKMEENCYLVGDPEALVVIDPGDESLRILEHIRAKGYKVSYVALTHCHYDHIGAVADIVEATGAKLYLGAAEKENYFSRKVSFNGYFAPKAELVEPVGLLFDGDVFSAGNCDFRVITTPGHTSGSLCLLCEGNLFSGDTLFNRGIGRADFPTGSLPSLVSSIKNKLFALDDATCVYPGHGPSSTIGYEKEHNEVYEWECYC